MCSGTSSYKKRIIRFLSKKTTLSSIDIKTIEHPILTAVQREVIKDIRKNKEYTNFIPKEEESLGNALESIYENTGNQFIILIDEWDCIFRNNPDDRLLQDQYIDWLRTMFKNTQRLPIYSMVYMTGILPIKRYHTQSALNNFMEYTFLNPMKMAEFSGFTEEEVTRLCEKYHVDFEEMNSWYKGYSFKRVGRIYNPRSVVTAIENDEFGNFWTKTGTYESVKTPIHMNFDGLKEKIITMIGGGRCQVNTTLFNNTMDHFESADDVMTFLVHLGYLAYDSITKETYIPNREIKDEFVNAINSDKWSLTYEAISKSKQLLEATLECDETAVASAIEKVHADNTSILKYNDENSLSCVIQIAYYQAQERYMLVREMPDGKGFCDIAFIPKTKSNDPAIVVELKWNQSAKTAIEQIKKNQYGEKLEDFFGEILLVGISYNKTSKKHICRIEKVQKEYAKISHLSSL